MVVTHVSCAAHMLVPQMLLNFLYYRADTGLYILSCVLRRGHVDKQ